MIHIPNPIAGGKFALIEARPYAEGSGGDHFSWTELLYARYAGNLCVSISVIEIRRRLNVVDKVFAVRFLGVATSIM